MATVAFGWSELGSVVLPGRLAEPNDCVLVIRYLALDQNKAIKAAPWDLHT